MTETLARSTYVFWGVNLSYSFRGDVFSKFTPMWSNANENNNNKMKSCETKTMSENIVAKQLTTKLCVNLLHGFQENEFYRRTTDRQLTILQVMCIQKLSGR